ncbi:MAG: hypothetical protein ACM3X1_10570 [Ignavibacteriales bacterium]
MSNTAFVVIAIVVALALLGVVAITIVTIPLQLQQAEAAQSIKGQCASTLRNASSSFCHTL